MPVLRSFLVIAMCLAIAAGSGRVGLAERATLLAVNAASIGPISLGVTAGLPESASRAGAVLLTRACIAALMPQGWELHTSRARDGTLAHCREYAARATAGGDVALLQALVAFRRGEDAAILAGLAAAQAAAPYQGWQAERRLVLLTATRAEGLDGPDWQALAATDIAALLHSQSGAELVARHYRQKPDMRALIAAALNRAEPANQRRLLNLLIREAAL